MHISFINHHTDTNNTELPSKMQSHSKKPHGERPLLVMKQSSSPPELLIPRLIPGLAFYYLWKLCNDKTRLNPRRRIPTPFISSRSVQKVLDSPSPISETSHNFIIVKDLLQKFHPQPIAIGSLNRDLTPELSSALTKFMANYVVTRNDQLQPILCTSLSSAMEILSFCLSGEPGDAFLVLSPYNPSYDSDLRWRSGVKLISVPCTSAWNFNVRLSDLDIAWNWCKKKGLNVRALVASNPSVPVGRALRAETLCALVDFVSEKNIHLMCDESLWFADSERNKFISVIEIMDGVSDLVKCRVHVVCELGLPGFSAGAIFSFNETVVSCSRLTAKRFGPVSRDIQFLLMNFLEDTGFVEEFFGEYRRRLEERYLNVEKVVRDGDAFSLFENVASNYCWIGIKESRGSVKRLKREMGEHGIENWKCGWEWHCIESEWFSLNLGAMSEHEFERSLQCLDKVSRRE